MSADWIDRNQLGRRNLSKQDYKLLLGRRYNRAKKSAEESGRNGRSRVGQNAPPSERTSQKLAREHGVDEKTVRRAGQFQAAAAKLGIDHAVNERRFGATIFQRAGNRRSNTRTPWEIATMPVAALVDDAEQQLRELKREALVTWRAWAEQLAAGGALPPMLELLQHGTLLGLREPASALAADATAIRDAADLDARAEAARQRLRERIARWGGAAEVRERIAALKRELAELTAVLGPEPHATAGRLAGMADRLRRQHPRVFPKQLEQRSARRAGR